MDPNDEYYQKKYLKYKQKYLELKRLEQEGGLFTFKSGAYTFFGSKDVFKNALNISVDDKSFIGKNAPSVSDLNSKLNNKGVYRIKADDKQIELVQSSGLQHIGKRIGQGIGATAGVVVVSLASLPLVLGGKIADIASKKSDTLRTVLKDKSGVQIAKDMTHEALNDLVTMFKGGKKIEIITVDEPYDGSNIKMILDELHKIHEAQVAHAKNGTTIDPIIDTAITIKIGMGFFKNKYQDIISF